VSRLGQVVSVARRGPDAAPSAARGVVLDAVLLQVLRADQLDKLGVHDKAPGHETEHR
jgi:hypothetical protein